MTQCLAVKYPEGRDADALVCMAVGGHPAHAHDYTTVRDDKGRPLRDLLEKNRIPPITASLGRSQSQHQPSPDEITIDDTHALMSPDTFVRLSNYSTSDPTGVYEGKMWRAQEVVSTAEALRFSDRWLLRWFGYSEDPNKCSYNQRLILIV